MFINYTSNPSLETVQRVLLESRSLYNIRWEKRMGEPCIYVANHALWSLDDFVALSAIPRRNLSIVMNAGPAGLTSIPKHCKEYVCVIHREEGVKGSGFKAMDEIIHSEILNRKKSLLVFPEDMKCKKDVNNLAPLRTGVIKLAMKYNIPIIPLWIDWPCQFPTLLNSCEKTVIIREGGKLLPEEFDSVDLLKNTVYKNLMKISK
jgi:1-acyl-sn-glycerol-3-phosphate acyltransferase